MQQLANAIKRASWLCNAVTGFAMPAFSTDSSTITCSVQVNEVEGLLAAAERKADALQSDKERLLSMVSRLELDKHRLESGRAPSTTPQQPATPGSFGQTTGCGIALCT